MNTKKVNTTKKDKKTPNNKDLIYFTERKTSQVKFNTSFVKFANLYAVKHTWSKYLIAAVSGFLMSLITIFLVEVTGLYTGGTTAFFQGLARFFYSIISVFNQDIRQNHTLLNAIYNLMFWGFYLLVNIPLLIFAYFKINKRFALLSTVYLICLQLFGFIWSLVPAFQHVMIFGDTNTVDENLRQFNIQVITFLPNVFPEYSGAHAFDWSIVYSQEAEANGAVILITSKNVTEFFLLVVYALMFSICSAFFSAVMYMISGSTAGGDIITIYFSQEKNKNLGIIMIAYNSIMMLLGVTFGSYLSSVIFGSGPDWNNVIRHDTIPGNPYAGWQYFISGNLISSFVWVLAHGMLIDRLFPWHKMVRVEIFANPDSVQKINDKLIKIKYTHPTTIIGATGGYSKKPINSFVTIMQCIELPEFIQIIRQIDDKCLISTARLSDLDGFVALQKQTW